MSVCPSIHPILPEFPGQARDWAQLGTQQWQNHMGPAHKDLGSSDKDTNLSPQLERQLHGSQRDRKTGALSAQGLGRRLAEAEGTHGR